MERVKPVKTFQEMVREGTLAGTDALITTGIAMVVIGVLAVLAPLASGVVFDMLFGALLIGAGVVELVDATRVGTWQRCCSGSQGSRPSPPGSCSSRGRWWAWSR